MHQGKLYERGMIQKQFCLWEGSNSTLHQPNSTQRILLNLMYPHCKQNKTSLLEMTYIREHHSQCTQTVQLILGIVLLNKQSSCEKMSYWSVFLGNKLNKTSLLRRTNTLQLDSQDTQIVLSILDIDPSNVNMASMHLKR